MIGNPTFDELLKACPQLQFTDVHYAVNYVCSLPEDSLYEIAIPWGAAYGAAIYNMLESTLGMFTGKAVLPHIYRQIARRIETRKPLFAQTTPWRVMLADGRYILLDGCPDIFELPNMQIVETLKAPLFTVSLDLAVVWQQFLATLAKVRNHGNYTEQAALQQAVCSANPY
jgi:hypothetical protein